MKTYIITGATSGIGKALAEYFAKDNIVWAGYRNESKKDGLIKISDNIKPFYIDYSKPETIPEAADYLKSQIEKVDTLINVAGCVVAGPVDCIPIQEFRRQFDVNVFGHIDFTQRLLSILDGGKIINISSMASYGIFPFVSPYCASKRALDIIFNSLALETSQNIKIVSVKPGVIATPLWSKSIEENTKTIQECKGYQTETAYLVQNAKDNEKNGLKVSKVVEKIAKIDRLKNPKPSYCVGIDSVIASFVSLLPQSLLNKLIKFRLKHLS